MTATPMFPLGSVVFPHTVLPLRVFEARYRRLMTDCLAGGREFGTVLITRGSEVGGGDHRSDLGTLVSVVEASEAADGQWTVLTVGTRRVRVARWLDDDPYPRAELEDAAEGPWSEAAAAALALADRAVRRSLALQAELGHPAPPVHVELDPAPPVAAWQLAAISPLGPLDRQALLTVDEPSDRLARLAALVEEENAVFEQRLALG
ncbi:MAG TPA: LON peptidase substrate-binding domain-containing protein [Acidimicrobiales bacterium]|nr:LON peptidase substrate-binding domain-containing protein [Acidimicrobiales bacterium]